MRLSGRVMRLSLSALLSLLLVLLHSPNSAALIADSCGCKGAAFSTICPPGLLCFNALKEASCRVTCSKGDLRYLYEFNWLVDEEIRCTSGTFHRKNGTAVPGVTQLTCTASPPCNKCPSVQFTKHCDDDSDCDDGLKVTNVRGRCTRVTCERGSLMVKRGATFRSAEYLSCSSTGHWYSGDGLRVDHHEVTCMRKRDCQSCPRPPLSDRCQDDEIVCIKELMTVSGGPDSGECRHIACRDSHVTVFMGDDKIMTDKSISCNAHGNWVLDTPKTEIATRVSSITCSVPICETCVELKLADNSTCPHDAHCNNHAVRLIGGPKDNLCNEIDCLEGEIAVFDGSVWIEGTSVTCDRNRRWITERHTPISNTAIVTCASYPCDTCPEVLPDPANRCPEDASSCDSSLLRTGTLDSHGCMHVVCQMGQLVIWSGHEFEKAQSLTCRAGKWRKKNLDSVGTDVVATCAFLPCQQCPPVQSVLNHADGSVEVVSMPVKVNPSNCSIVNCPAGAIALYEENKWRDIKSLTCNYDKQWYVVEEDNNDVFPEGEALTNYFIAKCAPEKSCQNCEPLPPTAACHGGFCDPTQLVRSMDAAQCKRTTCVNRQLMIQEGTEWQALGAVKCQNNQWITEKGKPLKKEAKATCKADKAPPPCQSCTYTMVEGTPELLVDECLVIHCTPKGKNIKVFNRYWGAFLSVWYIRCTHLGWVSQSGILINDDDPMHIQAVCDEGPAQFVAGVFPLGIPTQLTHPRHRHIFPFPSPTIILPNGTIFDAERR